MNRIFSYLTPLALAACAASGAANASELGDSMPRALYTQTNAVGGNEILVYTRYDDRLILSSRVATRGTGTDGGLGNQGALVLSENGRRLYAVNAGSNDVSVFAVRGGGALSLLQRLPSGGTRPVSLALHDSVLYALNAGDIGNVSGFSVADDGRLQAIPGATRPLSAAAVGPAQVEFNNHGDVLVVTEKATNKISVYAVEDGVARGPFVRDSKGMTPFGFAFDKRDHLIVSEAFGGAAGASALSSYDLDDADGPLELISGSVPDAQSAACWVVVTRNSRYAYTSNTASGNVSGYRVSRHGALSLLTRGGVTGDVGPGSGPTDLVLSPNSRMLASLNPPIGTIQLFAVRSDGGLVRGDTLQGVPASATGLVAR